MISYNPHTTRRLWAPRSAASCKKWSQTTKLSSGPPSHHGFFTVIERVLLSVHRDMTAVTQCMATICVTTCLRTSFWFVFYLIMPIWFVFYLMLPICSIFTSTSSPEHPQDRAAHTWDVLKVLSDRDACLHTVTWSSATHTWTSRRALGVGLISFCLLKCVQMDVLGMVALETSRARGAWAGQSLSCCQEQGAHEAGTNVLSAQWKVFLLCTQQQLQEMQLQTAANQGLAIPGGEASSLSRQRGAGFSLNEHFIALNNSPSGFMRK